MNWHYGKIELDSELTDIATAILLDYGVEGVEIVDQYENLLYLEDSESNWDYIDGDLIEMSPLKGRATLKFYIPKGDAAYDAKKMQDIKDALLSLSSGSGSGPVNVAFGTVEDNWSDAWKKHYKPFRVGRRIVIVPIWEEYEHNDANDVVFKIDPGHAFGTGQHQSTALCMIELEDCIKKDAHILDIGCGSGILAITALLLGAGKATAIDIDPYATKVCLENAKHNNIPPSAIKTHVGDIITDLRAYESIMYPDYDIITANIIADAIIGIAPLASVLLCKGGKFIAGGIIKDKRDDVISALEKEGLVVINERVQDEWVVITSMRPL